MIRCFALNHAVGKNFPKRKFQEIVRCCIASSKNRVSLTLPSSFKHLVTQMFVRVPDALLPDIHIPLEFFDQTRVRPYT